MTKKQLLAECVRIAPDFVMKPQTIAGRPCIVATCTVAGVPLELSNEIGGWGRARVEGLMLESCLQSLRKKIAAVAAA